MTATTPVARARCAECRRSYRVPDPARVYTCKACGGEVRAPVRGASPEKEKVSPEELEARRNASSELKDGYRQMKVITWLYRLGAFGYGAVTLAAMVALMSVDVPLRPGILVVALCTALTVTMLMGTIQLLFEPFVWTLVIAILATMVTAVHAIGPNPLGLAFSWNAVWALLFWAALVPALRFRRLIAQHTDLYVTHHASHSTRRALVGRSAGERHERLVRAMRRAFRRAIKVSALAGALIIAVSAAGTWLMGSVLRPQEVSSVVADFEQAWNDHDLEAVGGLFQPHLRENRALWLTGVTRSHGWDADWPQLTLRREWTDAEGTKWIEYDLREDATLTARWIPDRRRWHLGRVELPDPPIEPLVERLLAGWRDSDPVALASLYPAEHTERMLASIRNSLDLRGWSTLPEIRETRRDEPAGGEASVALVLQTGDVIVARWLLGGDGTWSLNALRFPEL